MRVNRLEIQVGDVAGAVRWWRELLPDAEVVREDEERALVEVGELALQLVRGAERGFGALLIQVGPERLDRVAQQYGTPVATDPDGSRFVEREAPGRVVVRVFTEPEPDEYAE
jgi:hypothetical protein